VAPAAGFIRQLFINGGARRFEMALVKLFFVRGHERNEVSPNDTE